MNHEELLRDTLGAKAAEASVDLTLEDIRRGASRRREQRRAVVLLAAAAVLAAVAVPTAVMLHDDGSPSPTPAPTTPPSASPTATAPSGTASAPASRHVLESIPQGRAPGITYLQDGVVHLDQGGTTPLPAGTAPVNAFTSYHGGWLVGTGAGGPDLVTWYDGTGAKKSEGPGLGRFAVSEDGTRTAYPQSGAIHIGITSGMSDSEQTIPGRADVVWPIGFLRGDALVYQAGNGKVAVSGAGTLPGLASASAVSATDDLVAGVDAGGQTVVVSRTGQVAWRSAEWSVSGFSTDGRYAAATNGASNGAGTEVAILDARTGHVVAQHALPGNGAVIGPQAVMDVDGSLLVAATDDTLAETVLRLDVDGTLTRATTVFPLDGASDSTYVMFATRP